MCSDGRLAIHSPGIIYASHLILLIAVDLNNMPSRLIGESRDGNTRDWLSRLLEMTPRCRSTRPQLESLPIDGQGAFVDLEALQSCQKTHPG